MNTPNFDEWTTEKLGEMIQLARRQVQQTQAAFEASRQEDRRKRKWRMSPETERAEGYARRIEDEVELMRAELQRRAIEACVAA